MKTPAEQIDGGLTMAEMWSGFAECCIIGFGPETHQYQDMKSGFYAGGLCVFNWMMQQLDPADEVTPEDLAKVDALETEIRAHFEEIRQRLAMQ